MNSRRSNKKNKPASLKHLSLAALPPRSARTQLSFSGILGISEAAVGVGGNWFFRLNSVYDPDASGVGSTAIGYSTWASLFLNYKVHRVTVRVQASVSGMTGGNASIIVAPLAYQTVVPANPNTWRAIPYAQCKQVAAQSDGGKNMAEFTNTYDIAKVLRVTKGQYANELDFAGVVGANPARQAYVMVGIVSGQSSTVGKANTLIEITYEVEWFNPVPLQ